MFFISSHSAPICLRDTHHPNSQLRKKPLNPVDPHRHRRFKYQHPTKKPTDQSSARRLHHPKNQLPPLKKPSKKSQVTVIKLQIMIVERKAKTKWRILLTRLVWRKSKRVRHTSSPVFQNYKLLMYIFFLFSYRNWTRRRVKKITGSHPM